MSLLDTLFSAKPSSGNPCLIEQPRFRITLPAGWTVVSPRDWRGKFVAKGTGSQSIEGQFNETVQNRRRPMQTDVIRKLIEHHRKEEVARGAQVHDETLRNAMTYFEAVFTAKDGIEARFLFVGPTCMLDVRATALTESMDLESIRRSLKAVEWR